MAPRLRPAGTHLGLIVLSSRREYLPLARNAFLYGGAKYCKADIAQSFKQGVRP